VHRVRAGTKAAARAAVVDRGVPQNQIVDVAEAAAAE
jgi:hypothetical protein